MKPIHLLSSTLVLLGASALGVGCQDSFKDCENTRTCPRPGDGDGDTSTGGGDGDGDTGGGDGDGDGDTGGTGGIGTGGGDGDGDSTGGMGGDPNDPCLLCEADEYCTAEKECVGCLNDDHCDAPTPVCDPSSLTCVGCVDEMDCEDPALPLCDGNTCAAGCGGPADCERFEATPVCDEVSGECVGCLPEGDDRTATDDICGTGVCNPMTLECDSTLTQMGKDVCEPCIADSECEADHNCVPMEFQGEPRVGGYCLKTFPGCSQPFSIQLTGRTSLSNVPGASYCGINETLATCEAVRALVENTTCADDSGCPEGGLCRTVGGLVGKRCTYECGGPVQCDESPNPGSTCGAGTAPDPVAPDYCGGD